VGVGTLATIDLDGQSVVETDEIHDVSFLVELAGESEILVFSRRANESTI
jgi:hypothetical protein